MHLSSFLSPNFGVASKKFEVNIAALMAALKNPVTITFLCKVVTKYLNSWYGVALALLMSSAYHKFECK